VEVVIWRSETMRARVAIATATLGLIVVWAIPGHAGRPASAVVATDPAGDWGSNHDPFIGPLGGPVGQDLLEASLAVTEPGKVDFVLKLAGLPGDQMFDSTRYGWRFSVDRTPFLLTNFNVECVTDARPNDCEDAAGSGPLFEIYTLKPHGFVGMVQADLDRTANTITISVPTDFIEARKGSIIAPYPKTDPDPIMAGLPIWGSVANQPIPYDLMKYSNRFILP
jgi:hypothetical protein